MSRRRTERTIVYLQREPELQRDGQRRTSAVWVEQSGRGWLAAFEIDCKAHKSRIIYEHTFNTSRKRVWRKHGTSAFDIKEAAPIYVAACAQE